MFDSRFNFALRDRWETRLVGLVLVVYGDLSKHLTTFRLTRHHQLRSEVTQTGRVLGNPMGVLHLGLVEAANCILVVDSLTGETLIGTLSFSSVFNH